MRADWLFKCSPPCCSEVALAGSRGGEEEETGGGGLREELFLRSSSVHTAGWRRFAPRPCKAAVLISMLRAAKERTERHLVLAPGKCTLHLAPTWCKCEQPGPIPSSSSHGRRAPLIDLTARTCCCVRTPIQTLPLRPHFTSLPLPSLQPLYIVASMVSITLRC
jgi:hypothetical protein